LRRNDSNWSSGLNRPTDAFTGDVFLSASSLECQVRVKVDLSSFYWLVSQPKSDDRPIDTGLQEFHRGSVPEYVGRYPLLAQRYAGFRRRFGVLCDQVLNAVMAQSPAASAWKEDFGLVLSLFANQDPQSLYGRSGERGTALLSSLTFAADVCPALQANVALAESNELRKAETSLNREQQQDPVSSAQPSRLIRHGQESVNLGPRQKIY
jgi:hypothetical protein